MMFDSLLPIPQPLTLRPYQIDALADIEAAFGRGKAVLIEMATGTGKTVVFLKWLARQPGGRYLIIAHRKELIDQPIARMRQFSPDLYAKSGVVMSTRDDAGASVICATVQTLAVEERLERILSHGAITHVVVDEAHHRVASTYRAVIDRLREVNPDLLELGVTATPIRTDRDGLGQIYSECAYRLPIHAAVRIEALCPFDAFGFELPVTLESISEHETEGGWKSEPLGDLLSAENVMEIVFEKWAELCAGRQTIGFTASVRQAHLLAEYFRGRGVNAESADGTTHKRERDAIIRRYRDGETQAIFNCQLWTEGFDAPETSAIAMIAPTKSDLVYIQRLGRGLRVTEGKANCRVLDFAPLRGRSIVVAGDVLGEPLAVKKARERAENAGVLVGLHLDDLGRTTSIDPTDVVIEILNLMATSRLAWALDGIYATTALTADTAAALVLPDARRLEKAEMLRRSDDWGPGAEALYQHLSQIRLYRLSKDGYDWRADLFRSYESAEEAKSEVDAWSSDGLGQRRSRWRGKPASQKQISYLMRLVSDVPESPTMGEASRMIGQALAIRAVKQAELVREKEIVRQQ